MLNDQLIAAMGAIIVLSKIIGSTNITDFQQNHYLNMPLRLFIVSFNEFLNIIAFLMFFPQL